MICDYGGLDQDRRGIYLPPVEHHWSLYGLPEQLENTATEEPGGDILHHVRSNGDILRYNARTNELVVAAKDGTIRTMFKPEKGINYWLKQVSP